MQNTPKDRDSGAYVKAGLESILGTANRYYVDLMAEISAHEMADGPHAETEALIVLRGKRAELENLLTALSIFHDHKMEQRKMAEISVIRDRLQLLIDEPRNVGNHEHAVSEELEKLRRQESVTEAVA